jgi:hypothetical protein
METSIFVTDLAQQFSLSLVGPLTLLSFVSGWPEQAGADFLILGLSFLIGWCLWGAPSLSAGLPSTILDIFGGLGFAGTRGAYPGLELRNCSECPLCQTAQRRAPDIRKRINLHQDYEARYWSEKFNVSRDELEAP